MARVNEILVGRYNRFLQKFLGMKGGPPAPQLASEIVASWAMFHGAENRYLEGWDRFAVGRTYAAVAASVNAVRIRNPIGSNVIAVMEKVDFGSTLTELIHLSAGAITADLATVPAITGRLDSRGRTNPTLILSETTAAAVADLLQVRAQPGTLGSTMYSYIGTDIIEFPIFPGDAIQLVNNTVNQSLLTAFMWRERFLEDSERT